MKVEEEREEEIYYAQISDASQHERGRKRTGDQDEQDRNVCKKLFTTADADKNQTPPADNLVCTEIMQTPAYVGTEYLAETTDNLLNEMSV